MDIAVGIAVLEWKYMNIKFQIYIHISKSNVLVLTSPSGFITEHFRKVRNAERRIKHLHESTIDYTVPNDQL